jgi:hypothetical protein
MGVSTLLAFFALIFFRFWNNNNNSVCIGSWIAPSTD